MKKKRKPIGSGNYRVCPTCGGVGVKANMRKYDKSPTNDIVVWEDCKTCKTVGWIEA